MNELTVYTDTMYVYYRAVSFQMIIFPTRHGVYNFLGQILFHCTLASTDKLSKWRTNMH